MIQLGKDKWMFPSKPGGGGLPQPYDPKNGEYVNMSDSEILEQEMIRINRLIKNSTTWVVYEPHFPTFGLHNDEYGVLFTKAYQHKFKDPSVALSKCTYLLDYEKSNGKAGALYKIGYKVGDDNILYNDIMEHTNFKEFKYNEITEYCYKVFAKTILRGHEFTTSWKVCNDFKLILVTMIPRGEIFDNAI